jgi:hypothetical protein
MKQKVQVQVKVYNDRKYSSQYNGENEYKRLLSLPDSYFGDAAITASSIATGRTPITSVGYGWVATVTLSECQLF